jgi:hypothetical protein
MKPMAGALANLLAILVLATLSKLVIPADHRPLIGIDGKRRDIMSGVIRLPFDE